MAKLKARNRRTGQLKTDKLNEKALEGGLNSKGWSGLVLSGVVVVVGLLTVSGILIRNNFQVVDLQEHNRQSSDDQNIENENHKLNNQNESPLHEKEKGHDAGTSATKSKTDFKKELFTPSIANTLRPVSMDFMGRKIQFKEVTHKNKQSSVHVYVADNFLSPRECDGLTAAHFRHVQETARQTPIFCFAGVDTMNKHLHDVGFHYNGGFSDFTLGTTCVNETFSKVLSSKFRYSFSTAFYRGDSKFSLAFEDQIEKATGLAKMHGGKFQITSYQSGIGYKNHTDCTESDELRDRFATALVYLQDVKQGGETKFPKLGISIKPKKGRLLVWNNMRSDGFCDPTSIHNAAKVEIGHKVILQRWYYYQSFPSLGKSPPEPQLPKRTKYQPRVSCDEYEQGSCRWYDEWGYDHLIDYNMMQHNLK